MFFTGCAISGTKVAVATISCDDFSWLLAHSRTRLFQMSGRTQGEIIAFMKELFSFTREGQIDSMLFCRTLTGYLEEGLANEARVDTILKLLPGCRVREIRNEAIREWSLQAQIVRPPNVPKDWRGLVEVRSIEVAIFQASLTAEKMKRGLI